MMSSYQELSASFVHDTLLMVRREEDRRTRALMEANGGSLPCYVPGCVELATTKIERPSSWWNDMRISDDLTKVTIISTLEFICETHLTELYERGGA